jgi:hypothetical protein
MKILIIQQNDRGCIGSSIICNNLRRAYPDAQLIIWCMKTTPVLEGNPLTRLYV